MILTGNISDDYRIPYSGASLLENGWKTDETRGNPKRYKANQRVSSHLSKRVRCLFRAAKMAVNSMLVSSLAPRRVSSSFTEKARNRDRGQSTSFRVNFNDKNAG